MCGMRVWGEVGHVWDAPGPSFKPGFVAAPAPWAQLRLPGLWNFCEPRQTHPAVPPSLPLGCSFSSPSPQHHNRDKPSFASCSSVAEDPALPGWSSSGLFVLSGSASPELQHSPACAWAVHDSCPVPRCLEGISSRAERSLLCHAEAKWLRPSPCPQPPGKVLADGALHLV